MLMSFLLVFFTTDLPLSSVEAGSAAIAIAGPNTAGACITDGVIACAKSAVCICDKVAVGFKANREALAKPGAMLSMRWARRASVSCSLVFLLDACREDLDA